MENINEFDIIDIDDDNDEEKLLNELLDELDDIEDVKEFDENDQEFKTFVNTLNVDINDIINNTLSEIVDKNGIFDNDEMKSISTKHDISIDSLNLLIENMISNIVNIVESTSQNDSENIINKNDVINYLHSLNQKLIYNTIINE